MLSGLPFGWMQAAPNSVAARTPFHFCAGNGGFQRSAPTGGVAYGIPLKTCTLPEATPCSLPAGALLLLVMNLVGLGLGPTYLGAASDWFRASHPEHSLQMAFYTLIPFYVLAVLLHLWLARALKREVSR